VRVLPQIVDLLRIEEEDEEGYDMKVKKVKEEEAAVKRGVFPFPGSHLSRFPAQDKVMDAPQTIIR
jgi:hypothetical protein